MKNYGNRQTQIFIFSRETLKRGKQNEKDEQKKKKEKLAAAVRKIIFKKDPKPRQSISGT